MNYRHAYHAGNHGDVLKHVLLTRILLYLAQKDAEFAVLDAHAGIGIYDLAGLEALKTGEWRGGIAKMFAADFSDDVAVLLQPYLEAVRAMNAGGALTVYPGSPMLARGLLRRGDQLLLNELHPVDNQILSGHFADDPLVRVTAFDAIQSIKAALPFPQRRGLVLIDPAFEKTDESARVAKMLNDIMRRMATVCVMIWYPVTSAKFADEFCAGLDFTRAKNSLRAELVVRKPDENGGLAGSGVIVVNPPWTLYGEAVKLLPALAHVMGEAGQGHSRLEWIVEPT